MEKDPITYAIIGCAMEVHKVLGPGFQEVIYQRALAIEFRERDLNFVREQEHDIFYKNQDIGTRRADFVVANKVVVELKAKIRLEDEYYAQAKNYTMAYDFPLGLLINFGAPSLQYKLMFNPKYHPKSNPPEWLKEKVKEIGRKKIFWILEFRFYFLDFGIWNLDFESPEHWSANYI